MNEFITDERYIPLRLLSNAYGRMEFTKLMSGMLPFSHDGKHPKEVLLL